MNRYFIMVQILEWIQIPKYPCLSTLAFCFFIHCRLSPILVLLQSCTFCFLLAGLRTWKEHIRFSSTDIIAALLSNSPQ